MWCPTTDGQYRDGLKSSLTPDHCAIFQPIIEFELFANLLVPSNIGDNECQKFTRRGCEFYENVIFLGGSQDKAFLILRVRMTHKNDVAVIGTLVARFQKSPIRKTCNPVSILTNFPPSGEVHQTVERACPAA